ncbi:MAG TPA: hypothetical protein VGM88_27425 [Kofleriaceae bacterium]|jgi:hypothetical protein
MRIAIGLLVLAACGGGGSTTPDARSPDAARPDALPIDAAQLDAPPFDAPAGFGALGGMCGVLHDLELTEATPILITTTMTFATEYDDTTDRTMLTPGGQIMMATPNAGGSSGLSEAFSYEELARCEGAALLATETEVQYDDPNSKKTDLEVMMGTHKLGVSVTRAFAYPLGDPYTLDMANTLIARKLTDIQASTAHAVDHWDKQILSVWAYDDQAADIVDQAWMGFDDATKANTIVLVIVSGGADTFIYTNQ